MHKSIETFGKDIFILKMNTILELHPLWRNSCCIRPLKLAMHGWWQIFR